MARYLITLGLVIGLHLQVFGQHKNYVFEQITSEAGITFNAVNSIITDDDGFVWFGTASGLYYYNTSEIIQYNFDPQQENTPPSNKITHLYKDRSGRIWICTDNGVSYFNETDNAFTRLTLKESDKFLNDITVSYILQYTQDQYLIVIDEHLYYFDIHEQVMREIQIPGPDQRISFLGQLADDQIYVGTTDGRVLVNQGVITGFSTFYGDVSNAVSTICYIDHHLWIGFNGSGIDVVDTDGKLFKRYREGYAGDQRIPSNRIRKIVQRRNGEIWMGSFRGISVIDTAGMHHIEQNLRNSLPHMSVFDLHVDPHDGVWVGTWSGGLAYYSEHNYKFPHIRIPRDHEAVAKSVISSFAEDEDGSIWIGVENHELEKFDPETMRFVRQSAPAERWSVSRIKSMSTDHNNRHWMGALYDGLWSVKDNKFERISDLPLIFSAVVAVDDGVWIGTRLSGLLFYDIHQDTFKHYRAGDQTIGSISSDRIWDVLLDAQGNLWICADFGLSVKYKNATDFERFFYNERTNSLSRNLNYTITEARDGKLWIGTAGAGIDIYDPLTKSFQKFSLNAAIATAEVYAILQDQQHNMWFSTNQGIYVYYPQSNTLRNFTEQDGILGKQYLPNSGFISSSGQLYFGGGNGFNIIDPTTVKQNPVAPEVFLSKLLINNKPLNAQPPRFMNSKFPAGIDRLELAYNQNSLTLGFVANNFVKSAGNKFRYRMEDYLDEWIETEQGKDVTFTKIPPGDYVLEVMAANNDGIWSERSKVFHLEIAPPVWLSWYAYLFYSLLLAAGVFVVVRELRFREKARVEKLLFSAKVKFFTNVSHEFRTPLTLILSPLHNLLKKFRHDPVITDHLNIVKRNADRLLHLTNQILDFRLIELNKMQLKRNREDLVSLCRKAYDCFAYEAAEKQINCIFNSAFKSVYLQVDAARMEKIIYNLISNGLKYSAEKGQLILTITEKILDEHSYSTPHYTGHQFLGRSLQIKVKDNGKGIKPQHLAQIFDRFFVDHESEETGIGIGLHMCQEYIQLHGGNIMVESTEGVGTVFRVHIPMEPAAELEKQHTIIQYHFDRVASVKPALPLFTDRLKTNKLILYVEDKDELRMYFKNLLSTKYKVLTAKNGQQALEIADEIIPDLIISDILMPGMNGLELTDHIRQSTRTDHIPIILLTALSDEANRIASMSKGANAFLTKPVDESFLFAKIENILRRQETIRKKIEGQTKAQRAALHIQDPFIERARRMVERNLQDPSFAITDFAAQLGISRSSLQRKIKAEVNVSPTEFIRDIRLKKAIALMKSGAYNIDEIGTLVGFNSTSYFIRSFKKKYGKTPFVFQSELKAQS